MYNAVFLLLLVDLRALLSVGYTLVTVHFGPVIVAYMNQVL